MTFQQDWTNAKKTFENKVKTKNPSDKFWTAFKKSASTLDKACKALDGALSKRQLPDLSKAGIQFHEACKTQGLQLWNASAEDKTCDCTGELKTLESALDDIDDQFGQAWADVLLTQATSYRHQIDKQREEAARLRDQAEQEGQSHDQLLTTLSRAVEAPVPQKKEALEAVKKLGLSCKRVEKLQGQVAALEKQRAKTCKPNLEAWAECHGAITQTNGKYSEQAKAIEAASEEIRQHHLRLAQLHKLSQVHVLTAKNLLGKKQDADAKLVIEVAAFKEKVKKAWQKRLQEGGDIENTGQGVEELLKMLGGKKDNRTKEKKEEVRLRLLDTAEKLPGRLATWLRETKQTGALLNQEWKSFPRMLCLSPTFAGKEHVEIIQEDLMEFAGAEETAKSLGVKLQKVLELARSLPKYL